MVLLEGGCRVTGLKEGEPIRRGVARFWPHVGRHTGAKAISLRVIEIEPGVSPGFRNNCDEVFYLLDGEAIVDLDGHAHSIDADTAVYLRPGRTLTIENRQTRPITFISSQCPEPESLELQDPWTSPAGEPEMRTSIIRLSDGQTKTVGDRWYRELVDATIGSPTMTQFVGSIPPGRAPDHFHEYEEVLCILSGYGTMWAGRSSTPVEPGSCIFLPRGQVHCVENRGPEELRLLGVFYPAGSPAVRYEIE